MRKPSTLLAVVLWLATANGYILPSTERFQQRTPLFQKPQTPPRTVVIDTLQLLPFYFPVKIASSSVVKGKRSGVRLNPVLEQNPFESLQARQREKQHDTVTEPLGRDLPMSSDASTTTMSMAQQQQRQQDQEDRRQAFFVASSAALAGFTDVLVLARHGCFVNMMTGTLLKMTTALANLSILEALVQASVVVSYMAGLRLFAQWKNDPTNKDVKLAPLRLVAPLVLGLFGMADVLTRGGSVGHARLVQVPLLAMGLAVVNAAAAHATGNTIFFAMTGHLTKLTNHGWPRNNNKNPSEADPKVLPTSQSILANFLGGALLAAVGLKLQQEHRMALVLPPLCTSLGLLYGALFAWYAPPPIMATLLFHKKKLQLVGRLKMATLRQRIRYALVASARRPTVANMLSPHNGTSTLATGF